MSYRINKSDGQVEVNGVAAREVHFRNGMLAFEVDASDGRTYHHYLNTEDLTLRLQKAGEDRFEALTRCHRTDPDEPAS